MCKYDAAINECIGHVDYHGRQSAAERSTNSDVIADVQSQGRDAHAAARIKGCYQERQYDQSDGVGRREL